MWKVIRPGKVFGRLFKRNCRKKACPVCFEGWAAAEAERALLRMTVFVVGNSDVERLISSVIKENRLFARSSLNILPPFRSGNIGNFLSTFLWKFWRKWSPKSPFSRVS